MCCRARRSGRAEHGGDARRLPRLISLIIRRNDPRNPGSTPGFFAWWLITPSRAEPNTLELIAG